MIMKLWVRLAILITAVWTLVACLCRAARSKLSVTAERRYKICSHKLSQTTLFR